MRFGCFWVKLGNNQFSDASEMESQPYIAYPNILEHRDFACLVHFLRMSYTLFSFCFGVWMFYFALSLWNSAGLRCL